MADDGKPIGQEASAMTGGGKGIEHGLLLPDTLMRRGYSAIVKNCGKLIATLTAVIVVLVTFTDIGFFHLGARELTANVILLLIASYIIYFSLEDAGETLGRETAEYRETRARLTALTERVEGSMIGELRRFLTDYLARELDGRRESMLSLGGYTVQEYSAYLNGGECDKRARRLFARVSRQRPIKLGIGTLLAEKSKESIEIRNPRGPKLIGLCVRLIPTTVCTVFTASVVLGLKDGLGAAEIIEGLVRLCPLPIVALRGYSQGYTYAAEAEVAWMKTKCRLLEAFFKEQCKV